MNKISRGYRLQASLRSAAEYGCFVGKNAGGFFSLETGIGLDHEEQEINKSLVGYPHNHNYRIYRKRFFPGFQLFERERLVMPQIMAGCRSFLDIGSCKGYYVLKTAAGQDCLTATGIDIYEPFITTSSRVRDHLKQDKARFFLADLEDVSRCAKDFGGPFQTVLLIGTYQYLFWGSGLSSKAYYSHREILKRLSSICTERVIISARLEVPWLSGGIREKARLMKSRITYTTEDFLKQAGEFFEVKIAGYLGKYPLFVLTKKG